MGKRRVNFSDQLRRAVDESGLSRYRICKLLDMDQATMSRFMSGTAGLRMSSLDDLADLLGLDVVVRKQRGRKSAEKE